MNRMIWTATVATALFMAVAGAAAHAETPWDFRPVVIDGGHTDARTAHVLDDLAKGSIGYHHARPNAPALWFRMEGVFGDRLQLRLGVPALDAYRQLRPAVAVLGPGLPAITEEIPFEVPEGYGGYVFHTSEQDIEKYTDKYAGTVSWRFEAMEQVLDVSGRYFVVGFIPPPTDPDARAAYPDGKFWMTVGNEVNFKMSDLWRVFGRTRQVRAFFEEAVTDSYLYRNGVLFVFMALLAAMVAVA